MSFRYRLIVNSEPTKSGVWEHRLEVTPGEHGIKLDLKLNVDVIPLSDTCYKVLGAVEQIKLVNWPKGLNGDIEVYDAYHSGCTDSMDFDDKEVAQYRSEIGGEINVFENPIAYKRVINKQQPYMASEPMKISLWMYWLSDKRSGNSEMEDCTSDVFEPDLKLRTRDNVDLYLKGDWIYDFSALLKRYREGNYDYKMTKSQDGCFECEEFDADELRLLFNYGNNKTIWPTFVFEHRFMAVMRAADYFGANRACGKLFALETRRLFYKGDTKDTEIPLGKDRMSVGEYLDLWHHAINCHFPEVVQMLARHTHWFYDELRADQKIFDRYCKLVAGISS